MSYRHKDWRSQPSSLPRRYYSLPRDYNSQDKNSRVKDTTYSSKHRTSSASATTPSTYSWRHGNSRTYGAPSDVFSSSDVKTSASHHSGTSAASSLGTSSFSLKSSLGRDKGGSLPSSPTKTRETSHLYSVRHVATFAHRDSTGRKSSWDPGTTPVRQHSNSSLKESSSTWGPDTAPVRHHSSSSLRDSPFGLTSSRRKYSSSKDSTSDEVHSATIQRTPSPMETSPKRSTSPSNVFYEGSQLKSEPSTSPVSPTALHYHSSLPLQGPSTSKSDIVRAASSRRGSSNSNAIQDVKIGSGSDNGMDASTARDISLLSREITSAYEGSLSRTDSRKGKNPLLSSKGKTEQNVTVGNFEKVEKSSKDVSRKDKDDSKASLLGRERKLSREKSHGTDSNIESHKRSSSVGSSSSKDEGKGKGEKYFGRKTGFFSRKKSRDSTDSEGEEERGQQKGSGFFQRRRSSSSEKESLTCQEVESSSPTFSPVVEPPKRKISGPSRLFFNSGESKTTPDLLKKKFSVPGKYFPSKDSKSGGDSSDNMDSESGRLSCPPVKRRVSLPGILGLHRSSSAERAQVNPVQSVDPEGLSRRTNFKKARSFDSSKNTMLNKLKFWDHTKKDKSPDSRKSTSSDDGRSRSLSPASSSVADKSLVDEVFVTDGTERKSSQLRKSRERTVKPKSVEEKPTPGGNKSITTDKSKPDQGRPLLDKGQMTLPVESVPSSDGASHREQKDDKEPKEQYVGSIESPLLAELRAKRRAQYKVNSNEKGSGSSMYTAVQDTDGEVKKEENKPFNLTDSSTRDTVSKLRERRRRRKEERERFFAGLVPTLAKESNQEEGCKDEGGKELGRDTQETPVIARQDAVDGKLHFGENGFIQKNGFIHSKNSSNVRQTPQLSEVGKKYTIDDMSNTEKVKSGKPRYQTIASSVHADIIADLIREKGLKTTDAEVKIPSVAELRAKFLISKDDNKVIPPRPVIMLEDRPHSICGDTLSPTEMRKFDEINFSLAKKVSSSKIDEQKFSDSSSEMLSPEGVTAKLDIIGERASLQNPLSSRGGQSAPREESIHIETSSKDLEKDPRDLSPEGEVRKKRGSKKKRKKSLFGGDKEAKGVEEEGEMPQSGAVSAAIKAMFSRRGSVDKSKISRKQRSKTIGSEGRTEILKGVAYQRERKKSSPEYLPPNLTVGDMQTKGVGKKELKKEKIQEVKDNGKAEQLESNFHVQGKVIEQKALGKDRDMEINFTVKDKEVGKNVLAKDKEMERKVLAKDREMERKVSGKDERILSGKDRDIQLQPIEEIEQKSPKERKSLKKPSKNKKRKSLKPFSMMKTKSESNLFQRFDFVAVEIPLENEEVEKQDWNEKEQVEKQVDDKPSVQEALLSPIIRGRRPSVFEEGLRDFYDMKVAKQEADLKKPEPSKVTITLEDLDAVSNQTAGKLTSSLAEDRMKIRPRRHHQTKSNPIKNLQNRDDVRTDTEVEKPRIEKKPVTSEHPVIKRKKKKYKDPDNLYRRHTLDLAASALAGLASTEDFTKVLLRKTAGPNEKDEYRGTKPTMLIHIKGRRHLQVRLTEPCQKSLNSGDCFALVTEKDLFAWIGKDCNPYEKAKVTEIVSKIKTKSELDCKAREIVTIEEGDEDNIAALDKFWKILNGDPDVKIKGGEALPKDEEYEKGVVKGNMVYKIHWTDPPTLMSVETMCGHLPQVSILDTKEVFVFDFGSELYVWNGQQSLSGQRKSAFALARQLYEQPFKPYGIYDPIYPYGKSDQCIIEVDNKHPSKRPRWTLFARLHEKAETILFREKFLDWPDPTKIIRMKGHPSCLELAPQPSPPVELRPCDVKKMLQDPGPLQCPTFEGVNVGRGNGVPTVWVGDVYKEGNLVTTVGLTVWHINEYRHFELPSSHHGHFHSGEGYVIRWAYFVLADRVVKDRKSRCRSTVAGRVRCAYFFWQGNDCSVNEKGAAAIMAVELDEEKGPQVRVVQGKENPVFLNLFKGGMIIHQGSVAKSWYDLETKKVDEAAVSFTDTSTVRLYVIRNEEPGEACLHQVKANSSSLRSRTSFVLLLCRKAHIFLWHGSKSSEDSRSAAKTAAKNIQERKSVECNVAEVSAITLTEVEEGNEPDDFWKELGGKKYYCSLANDPAKHRYQPRLFELSSATGNFASSEVLCPSRSEPKVCPFPFLQNDLYSANQPGLFIVDGYYEVYVWEGWMLENDDDVRTGSGRQRWDRDRRLAMQTALNYAKEVGKRVSHRVYVVYAGMEPQSFKVLFPYWNDSHDITRIQKQDGKQINAKHLASDLLESFTKEFYTLEELRRVPPPQGVDPSKLEDYLNDSDFKEIFKMDKEAFNKLPLWKRQDLKKPVGLF